MRSQQRKQVQGLSGPRDESKEEPASLFPLHPPSVSLPRGLLRAQDWRRRDEEAWVSELGASTHGGQVTGARARPGQARPGRGTAPSLEGRRAWAADEAGAMEACRESRTCKPSTSTGQDSAEVSWQAGVCVPCPGHVTTAAPIITLSSGVRSCDW